MKKQRKNHIGLSREDRIMYAVVYIVMALLIVVICYPLIYVVSSSLSSGRAVTAGRVVLWPVDFSLTGFELVLSYKQVWSGYLNSIIITVVGTALNLVLTVMAAYPLSRRDLPCRGIYLTLFMITMFISGGILPSYILMSNLKLTNTLWSVILSGGLSITNMIIMMTYFRNSIPYEMFEAAKIDGITDWGYLFRIVLPLSKAIIAVIILYYAVGRWNSYFTSMLYLRDRELYPLQLVLRDILNTSRVDPSQVSDGELLAKLQGAADQMKYSLIVISTAPLLIVYPFVQKYFEKGVMIGSVKG